MVRKCPYCKHDIDAATCLSNENAKPKANDISICAYCAGILVFTGNGYESKKMTNKDFKNLPSDVQETLKKIVATVKKHLINKPGELTMKPLNEYDWM